MDKKLIGNYICRGNASIVEAMRQIGQNTAGLIYVVEESGRLIGCLSDGDIRRWIIQNGTVEGYVFDAMNHDPKFITQEQTDIAVQIMKQHKIFSLAVVDGTGQILDVVFDPAIMQSMTIEKRGNLASLPVVIMAGGKGTRLYPYTKILPKPLIPIGEVPVIERILNRYVEYGVEDFWLSINYKKEMIKSYFSELSPSYRLHYVEEKKPLGTAGSIGLIRDIPEGPMIIANCDNLIDADYSDMLQFHNESQNAMTIVSSLKNIVIPYGVLHSEMDGVISSVEEKPRLSYFINTGMYILNTEYINWIPKDRVFHMTQLVEMLIKEKKKVGMYPISEEAFLDMGEFEEMKKMEERINLSQI